MSKTKRLLLSFSRCSLCLCIQQAHSFINFFAWIPYFRGIQTQNTKLKHRNTKHNTKRNQNPHNTHNTIGQLFSTALAQSKVRKNDVLTNIGYGVGCGMSCTYPISGSNASHAGQGFKFLNEKMIKNGDTVYIIVNNSNNSKINVKMFLNDFKFYEMPDIDITQGITLYKYIHVLHFIFFFVISDCERYQMMKRNRNKAPYVFVWMFVCTNICVCVCVCVCGWNRYSAFSFQLARE